MAILWIYFPLFKKALKILIFASIWLVISSHSTFAQETSLSDIIGDASLGVAHTIEVKDQDVQDGSIISTSDKGAILTAVPYDSQILGVVARDAAIIIDTKSSPNGVPIMSNGTVYVLVSSLEGNIKKDDLITSSTKPGVAVKATRSGYVLGSALEDYENPNPEQVDKIAVKLDLHYFNSKPLFPGSLSDILKIVVLPTNEGPSAFLKYLIAALVVLGSFVLGFMSFGRTAAKGVEALGRNPSASKVIHLGIILNVGIVVAIVLSGLAVAFMILRL